MMIERNSSALLEIAPKNFMALHLFIIAFLNFSIIGCSVNLDGDETMTSAYFTGKLAELEVAVRADDPASIAAAIASGADVNGRGEHMVTPLIIAVDRLKATAVAELLAQGADPNLRADDGASAVSLAVDNYRAAPEIMEQIFEAGGNPNTLRPNNNPVIMRFVHDRNCERLRYMKSIGADLDVRTRADDPIITDAAVAQDWDIVWCLIELNARYDYETTARSPISRSLSRGFPAPDSPIYPYKVKVWEFLKSHGIAVPPLD
ncbi:MAG: ankyrin repeat domain-containing protein [Lamprobacter sp.]|uniref:ankyrin repeat domain-containing protein n=1 Tax=Lamprobacter sp. TaxID=3100796 RepID=UPI002B25F4EB|nr:ankyrin repeat domain-containing protein [Lamprobacter sp.]MEA3642485.1 ankyrin repeat domain-containing protein [Lamprobacter sp.]